LNDEEGVERGPGRVILAQWPGEGELHDRFVCWLGHRQPGV